MLAARCIGAALGVALKHGKWIRNAAAGLATVRVAVAAGHAVLTAPQARITKNTADLASTMEEVANAATTSVLREVEGEDSGELMKQLAGECFHGNPVAGKRRARMSAFYRHWVAELRLEFPLRADRPSDRGAMSKWLHGQMRAKGLRATHAADAIPKIVALAINPSRAEVEAAQWADEARLRTVGGAWWRQVARLPLRLLGLTPREAKAAPPGFA